MHTCSPVRQEQVPGKQNVIIDLRLRSTVYAGIGRRNITIIKHQRRIAAFVS